MRYVTDTTSGERMSVADVDDDGEIELTFSDGDWEWHLSVKSATELRDALNMVLNKLESSKTAQPWDWRSPLTPGIQVVNDSVRTVRDWPTP